MTKFAISTRAIYEPGSRPKAERLAEVLDPVYRSRPGFEDAHFILFDEATGEYGSLVVFDTRPHAEAALDASRPVREKASNELGIARQGSPERRIVELFGPGV